MAFKRALWSSGLTYQQKCEECHTVIKYKDDVLDFRPWFPDGFVYCPKCSRPLRHNEAYAIDKPQENFVDLTKCNYKEEYCSNCGKKYLTKDNFCVSCGAKRK